MPEVILFMFAKYRPDAAFHIGLDEDVIRNYTEYERLKIVMRIKRSKMKIYLMQLNFLELIADLKNIRNLIK
ncbi:hypothetical protein ACT7DL_13190 [Bacillus paranthracis]